jgi:hypothetical protein
LEDRIEVARQAVESEKADLWRIEQDEEAKLSRLNDTLKWQVDAVRKELDKRAAEKSGQKEENEAESTEDTGHVKKEETDQVKKEEERQPEPVKDRVEKAKSGRGEDEAPIDPKESEVSQPAEPVESPEVHVEDANE